MLRLCTSRRSFRDDHPHARADCIGMVYLTRLSQIKRAAAVLLCVLVIVSLAQSQTAPTPLTKDDVLKLLTGGVPMKRVEVLVREHGIDFQVTPGNEAELRSAGATDPLIALLKELAPKSPVLIVTTTPGGAQVFIDDELIARTSAEGRLKITTLAAGSHKLRVSLDGYNDNEQNIDLVASLEVTAKLDPVQRPAAESPAAATNDVADSGASAPKTTLSFPGRCSRGGPFLSLEDFAGIIEVGGEKLHFTAQSGTTTYAKHSFDVSLSDIVPITQWRDAVQFNMLRDGKVLRMLCYVRFPGNGNATANIDGAKKLFSALKAGSK